MPSCARRPLVAVACAFTAGILIADGVFDPAVPLAAGLTALLVGGLAFRKSRPAASLGLIVTAFSLGLGFLHGQARFRDLPQDHILLKAGPDRRHVKVRGFLTDEPVLGRNAPSDVGAIGVPRLTGELRLVSIDGPAGPEPCEGLVKFRVVGPEGDLHIGDPVEFIGEFSFPDPPTNPGEWDYGRYLRRQGYAGFLFAGDGSLVSRIQEARGGGPVSFLRRLRGRLSRNLSGAFDPEMAGFLRNFLLGEREGFDPATQNAFARTGTLHYVAISGFHFIVLLAFFTGCGKVLPVSDRALALALLALAATYAILVGGQPSVVRSVIMCSVFLGGPLFGRIADGVNSLALALLACLALNPGDLWNPGFQLSFAAVAGLMFLYPAVESATRPSARVDPLEPPGRLAWGLRRAADFARRATVVTFSAWIFTMPIVACHFHLVSPIGLLANLLIFLPITVVLVLGFLFLVLGLAFPGGAALLAVPIGMLVRATVDLVLFVDGWGLGSWYVAGPSPAWVLAYAVVLGVLLWGARRGVETRGEAPRARRWSLRPQTAALSYVFLLVLYLASKALAPGHGKGFEAAYLDVGHGLAVVVTTPGGAALLYDAGSDSRGRIGERVAVPFLWNRAIPRLDAVILSHPDRDHTSGLLEILDRVAVGRVLVSPHFDRDRAGRGAGILAEVGRRGIPITRIARGDRIVLHDGTRLPVVHPPAAVEGMDLSSNEASVSWELSAGGETFLFTGDVEEWGLLRLTETPREGGLYLVPHHGRKIFDHAAFAAALRPRLAIVSSDREKYDRNVIRDFARRGARVLVTGEEGAVTVRAGDGGFRVETFLRRTVSP